MSAMPRFSQFRISCTFLYQTLFLLQCHPPHQASVSSLNSIPYFFSASINGSLILGVYGANIPFSEIVPSSTCNTANPHGTPTSLAMAEYPFGSPYSTRVDVRVSLRPSLCSISNLLPGWGVVSVVDDGFEGVTGKGGGLLLQHHHVSLAWAVFHLCFKSGAEGV